MRLGVVDAEGCGLPQRMSLVKSWKCLLHRKSGPLSETRFLGLLTSVRYPPEILPLKVRVKGAALVVVAVFLSNFIVVESTLPALQNVGYKTYIIFAVLKIINTIVIWALYPETAGSTLESVDFLFTNTDEMETQKPFYHLLQWSVAYQA